MLVQPVPLRCVVIVYPHTSNWDFPLGLLMKWAVAIRFHWVGKDSLFRWPLGPLLRRLGGVAVNRRERTRFVERLAAELERYPVMRVVITPEGTRARTDHWKSGFYHLARATGVPLALAFIDYSKREIGIGAYHTLTGDVARDMAGIGSFYAGRTGRHPAQQGPIRLRSDVAGAVGDA